MFGWFRIRKVKVRCPKCGSKLTLSYDKDAVFETYEIADIYENLYGKILAKKLCHSCKTELLIIQRETRQVWDTKYTALDVQFEAAVKKYLKYL